MEYLLITAHSTHLAMKLKKKLRSITDVEIIPTPRNITESCGISIKVALDKYSEIKECLPEEGIQLFKMIKQEHDYNFEKWGE